MVDVERERMKCLIPQADDCGSFREANEACLQACTRGWLLNVSFMAPCKYFKESVALLKEVKHICRGLHLTLTCEWTRNLWGPVGPTHPKICDAHGHFFFNPLTIHEKSVQMDLLINEAMAQIRYARSHGLVIDYMDHHMGVGWVHEPDSKKRFEEYLQEICDKEKILWIPKIRPELVSGGETASKQSILDFLKNKDGICWLCKHPAIGESEMTSDKFINAPDNEYGKVARERESGYRMFLDMEFKVELEALGFELKRWNELDG